ncbi:MAG TPA: hypothetical protein PK659_07495 [Methanothrix sp.]|nr:hypothetical protein [Methanothrix sp.]HOL44076.1 hypothetical protein [Methanothrix sp.]
MATYSVGGNSITSESVGISIERSTPADNWRVRLYVQDIFPNTVVAYILSHPISCSVSVADSNNTVTFTGTAVRWQSNTTYSYVDIWNAVCTVS